MNLTPTISWFSASPCFLEFRAEHIFFAIVMYCPRLARMIRRDGRYKFKFDAKIQLDPTRSAQAFRGIPLVAERDLGPLDAKNCSP